MSLSEPMMSVLREFESAFSQPTWSKMQVLLLGTLLARGSADRDGRPPPDGLVRRPQL